MLSSILDAEGIVHLLHSTEGKGHIEPPSIWIVKNSDYERARELVADYERAKHHPHPEGGGWRCSKCGESLSAAFTECWKCRSRRV